MPTRFKRIEKNKPASEVFFALVGGKTRVKEIQNILNIESHATVSTRLKFLREENIVEKDGWEYSINWEETTDMMNEIFLSLLLFSKEMKKRLSAEKLLDGVTRGEIKTSEEEIKKELIGDFYDILDNKIRNKKGFEKLKEGGGDSLEIINIVNQELDEDFWRKIFHFMYVRDFIPNNLTQGEIGEIPTFQTVAEDIAKGFKEIEKSELSEAVLPIKEYLESQISNSEGEAIKYALTGEKTGELRKMDILLMTGKVKRLMENEEVTKDSLKEGLSEMVKEGTIEEDIADKIKKIIEED